MASASYSFIDVAVLDGVRACFAAGDDLVIMSPDLEHVVWANGSGAALLGFSSIEAVIDSPAGLSAAARRQIGATIGFPDVGRDRPIAIRLRSGFKSRIVNLLASGLVLPDGERALLLVHAAPSPRADPAETAMNAIGGFTAEGQFAAMLDAEGEVVAASAGFDRLGVTAGTLQDLVRIVGGQPNRLIKRRIEGENGRLPAGLARLTDDPAMHLLIVVDETQTGSSDTAASGEAGDHSASGGDLENGEPEPSIANDSHSRHDGWYFDAPETGPAQADETQPADVPVNKAGAGQPPDSHSSPVRFVWRMDSESRFTMISDEFITCVGAVATDIIGHRFRDVANAFGIDSDGEISALMERRDTWSGRTVMWPLAHSSYRVPVDLAALPAYDRDRLFQGFRGFGMLRPAEAVDDAPGTSPDAATRDVSDVGSEIDDAEAAGSGPPEKDDETRVASPIEPASSGAGKTQDEPAQQPDADEKVIRLAEHRSPAREGSARAKEAGLSRTEQSAFREIADRLRRESSANRNEKPARNETAKDGTPGTKTPVPETTESPEENKRDASGDSETGQASREPAAAEPGTTAPPLAPRDEAPRPPETSAIGADADESAPTPAPPANVTFLPSAFSGSARADGGQEGVDPAILSHLPVPVLVHSGDTLFYANEEFLRLTGYEHLDSLAEAGGIDAIFADPPEDAGPSEDGARTLRLRNAQGVEFAVEAHLQSIRWNGGSALLLALRRADEGHSDGRAEKTQADTDELRMRLDEMRAILDTATDGVVIMDNEGVIRSISRPAEALFGFESSDVAGKSFAALFAIESQRAARDYLESLSGNGVASVLNDGREVIGREAQGRFIPLFMTIGRLPNASGFCAVVRDITQWKRAEEELTQARAQAEHSSSQKTEFLARVSHEIRTPLNAIIGFSELMMDEKFGPIGSDRYRDYLRDINKSGNHVLDLVNDLLDISKIEAGEQEMHYEAVSLNDTIGEAVAMMQPQANRERVIIRSSFSSRLPEVVADLRSIKQIALNLLSNAVRYTPAGGQVIVSTTYEAAGIVAMRVRDTGHGMSPEELDQALKPFKQLNTLKRTRGDGTGLGLPLTRAMVEANRARFSIKSTPGEGTLVEITFPSTRVLAD